MRALQVGAAALVLGSLAVALSGHSGRDAGASDFVGTYVLEAAGPPYSMVGQFAACWFAESNLNDDVGSFCGGSACNLTDGATMTYDTTNFKQGSASFDFDGSTDFLTNSSTAFDFANLTTTTSVTVCAWVRPSASQNVSVLSKHDGSGDGFFLEWRNSGARMAFEVDNNNDVSATNTALASSWTYVCGRFDHINDQIEVFTAGAGTGSPTTENTLGDAVADDLAVGADANDTSASRWQGQIDELCFAYKGFTTAALCFLCSCGVEATGCACNDATPTSYDSAGRNATDCGSCTLPDCNISSLPEIS